MQSTQSPPKLMSVVVPVYNEEEGLAEFQQRLMTATSGIGCPLEVVYVNDGSTDNSLTLMYALREQYHNVAVVNLSRNFGKEIALTAGLDHATGDVIVVIDADLQDPPEVIPALVEGWLQGYDVVYATRTVREGEGWFKKRTASWFYQTMQHVGPVKIPANTGDFRLMSRRALDALKRLPERHRFMKGLFTWIGFPQKSVQYRREPRFAGTSKWNYWKLWNLSLEGITGFTITPLKISTYLGMFTASIAIFYAAWIVFKTLLWGDSVHGYPSLMTVILMLSGVQLTVLGILGEYIGRIFNETKQRPLYLVQDYEPLADELKTRSASAR